MSLSRNTRIVLAGSTFLATLALLFATAEAAHAGLNAPWDAINIAVILGLWVLLSYVTARMVFASTGVTPSVYEFLCVGCGYDLRGCVSAQCPECGLKLPEEIAGVWRPHLDSPAIIPAKPRIVRRIAALALVVIGAVSLAIWMRGNQGAVKAPPNYKLVDVPFQFVGLVDISVDEKTEPIGVFVRYGDRLLCRLEFSDDRWRHLTVISIWDTMNRPWVTVDFDASNIYVNQYSGPNTDPRYTTVDENVDGLPERRVEWPARQTKCLTDPQWGECTQQSD